MEDLDESGKNADGDAVEVVPDPGRRRDIHLEEPYALELLLRKPSLRSNASTRRKSLDDMQYNETSEDTRCGIGCIRGEWLQSFANEKVFVFLYGILGCFYGSYFAYFNGTITTLEKRFKIQSRTMGIIATGCDITHIFVSPLLSYYTGTGHRPRWIGFGVFTVVLTCIISVLPHLIYGPGKDVMQYTVEYSRNIVSANSSYNELNLEYRPQQQICNSNSTSSECSDGGEGMMPVVILLITQVIQGFGDCLYFTIGTAYMDDNIKKTRTPAMISFSYVLRMLGPAFGYWLSSVCLKIFVTPTLTPIINDSDPRWIGAWWLGYLFIGFLLFLNGLLLMMFPKTLPKAAARQALMKDRATSTLKASDNTRNVKDMVAAFKRLLNNAIFNCNNFASVFSVLWYMAYWIFLPKYIETEYRQSASSANFYTGTITLIFSTTGILVSGGILTRYRPKARMLAGWNVLTDIITVLCLLSYPFLGCTDIDKQSITTAMRFYNNDSQACLANCRCDYVMYSPVCSELNETFVSPCHAGCKNSVDTNGTRIFTECECIALEGVNQANNRTAFDGACPVNCDSNFYIFLGLICIVTFIGSTARPTNFLVQIRCVEERDKSLSLGVGMTILSVFAFIPSPILFGYILDTTCLIWGKTCESQGNCWLYDSERLRYVMNFTAVAFISISTLFDVCIWYFVKDLRIFHEAEEKESLES